MSPSLWSIWNALARFGHAKLTSEEWAAVILLGCCLLVLRTFRETNLAIWTLGWLVLLMSRMTVEGMGPRIPARYLVAVAQSEFALAVGLFVAGVFVYTRSKKLLAALAVITLIVMGFAFARVVWWPDSLTLRVALEISYRTVLVVAAIEVMRARWGRWEMGPLLLGLSLPFLQLPRTVFADRIPGGVFLVADLCLGLSMMLVVFEESHLRTRRLAVVQALTGAIAGAHQYDPMLQTALEEIQRLSKAKVAWFRLLEADRLVVTHTAGLSQDSPRAGSAVHADEDLQDFLERGQPRVANQIAASHWEERHLKAEGIRQVVMVPVVGKKSPIGILVLGRTWRRSYTPEDLEFLQTCARQLGIAVENLRLLEQVLRSQRQWINTFDSIHDIIFAHDAEFHLVKANHALLQHLGRATADVVGNTCVSILPRTVGEWSGCPYCDRGDEDFTEAADPCFGGFSAVSTSSYTEQGSKTRGTIHVVRDTTERRSAEQKYRLLFEQVQEGVFIATPAGKLLDCNDAFVHMLGYRDRQELLAVNLDSDIRVDAAQRETFQREIEAHNYVRNFEVTLRRKDGSLLLAAESSFATRDNAGNIERYQGFVLDVTEKRRAEDEMRRRNRELNALNAMAVVATQSFDLDEILNLTLRQVVSLFGAESGSVYLSDTDAPTYRRRAAWGPHSRDRGRAAEITLAEGFGDLVMRSRAEVITAEYLPHLPAAALEFIRGDQDRSWIWMLFWGKDNPIGIMGLCSYQGYEYSSSEENLLVAISRQLATTIEKVRLYEETCRAYEDLRRTQEQLLQSEKMSAVGQLISGVAHELNNPLTAILGYAQLLESEGLSDQAQDYVTKLFKQAQRTHRVVQNLLSFARQRKPERQEVDIRKVLDETLALRDYDLKVNNIAVEREIPPDAPIVVADPHQIEQVFLNIINNSVDALLETGKAGKIKIRIHSENGHVSTQFIDDGPGIKDPKRIFDPFYTTKSVGRGTGLGLSICYGIVKEHGGDITAYNRPEGGAVVEVRLPVATHAAALPEAVAKALSPREAALEGRVLLVEEEEAVLEFERDVLSGAGASVVTAKTSAEVKTRLLSEHFDAVIMNGAISGDWNANEAHAWLKQNCEGMDTHVVFTFSNALEQGATRAYLSENNISYLVKPFEVADLISQARRLLQKARAAAASAG
jgi:PAS domain S-box-containing protein